MASQAESRFGDDLAKQIVIATAASVAAAIIGAILLPGVGTALGAKMGAACSGCGVG